MPTKLLADNWTLQNAGEFLEHGLQGDIALDFEISEANNSFRYRQVNADGLRFDALCQVLSNLVLCDQQLVDDQYIETWQEFEALDLARSEGFVVPKSFTKMESRWLEAREGFSDALCANEAVREAHQQNKRQWAKDKTAYDPMLSQLVWGGAGMLARADYLGLNYSPHPLREQLFLRNSFMKVRNSRDWMDQFIQHERLNVWRKLGDESFVAKLKLPPVVIQVIHESSSMGGLVKTALQLRDDYRRLRKWLADLQTDLSNEATRNLLSHKKRLADISKYLDSMSAPASGGNTTVQIALGILKMSHKREMPVSAIKNRFGMRAELSRLILAPEGRAAVEKLIKMLGEQSTKRGAAFKEMLMSKQEM